MFTRYRTKGFVLKKTDRGEYGRIFTIYTKDFGKLELLAKAERKIKSKLRGGLELFYLSDIEFIQGKAYRTLTDASLIDNFKFLRQDFRKLILAFKISEVLDRLIRGQEPDQKVWQLSQGIFKKLNDCHISLPRLELWVERPETIYYYFLWNLFSILGYRPNLYDCSVCQKKLTIGKIYFSFKSGGLICNSCQKLSPKGREINSNAIKIVRLVLKEDWLTFKKLKFNAQDLKSLKLFSKQYLSDVLRQME